MRPVDLPRQQQVNDAKMPFEGCEDMCRDPVAIDQPGVCTRLQEQFRDFRLPVSRSIDQRGVAVTVVNIGATPSANRDFTRETSPSNVAASSGTVFVGAPGAVWVQISAQNIARKPNGRLQAGVTSEPHRAVTASSLTPGSDNQRFAGQREMNHRSLL